VAFHTRHRWLGFDTDGVSRFATPDGPLGHRADATVLALGGASWPQLGATGAWCAPLAARGVRLAPWQPANCGFLAAWDEPVRRHQGTPLKNVAATFGGVTVRGEVVLTACGLEGGPVYALAAALREAARCGTATLVLDLKPDLDPAALGQRLARPHGRNSLSSWLRKTARLGPAAAALLRWAGDVPDGGEALARRIKALPIPLQGPAPLAEAISSAGGVLFDELDETLMVARLPGVFVAGEMIDWEAPTGGYLITGCLATGWLAGNGAARYALAGSPPPPARCHDNVS
ncbi:MAG: TIGR03862 family flavoprotein, partial [Pseudodonghicola sp.]